ncbi:nitroreductase family protein [Cryptosporangium minutisporangium]|uniref:Nitroreductase family protein n=2 Tax=Cryptosporangium minutisporangium TaxID=113569 RepID=A0ABP6T7U5_9ACTN
MYTSEEVLRDAAATALLAPSIFNTQPWRWEVRDSALELRTDRSRQLAVTDPMGRMLTISCGLALHHALVALAAEGRRASVERLPDESDRGLLARITLAGVTEPADVRLRDAISRRHTDRRPFAETAVPDDVIDRLRTGAEARGVYLAELHADSLVRFQVTAARAGELDADDPAYQAELAEWTHRPADTRDGVTPATAVAPTPRKVPLRSFFPAGAEGLLPGPGHDGGARYLVLWTTDDTPADWLAAGEAMSAVLLETTASGLAASPMTDVVEVPASRALLHRLLDNLGNAQAALRIGVPATDEAAPPTPRRAAGDVIDTDR